MSASNLFTRSNSNRSIVLVDNAIEFDYLIKENTPFSSRLYPNYNGRDDVALNDLPQDCHDTWVCTPPELNINPRNEEEFEEENYEEGRGSYNKQSVLNNLALVQNQINNLSASENVMDPYNEAFYQHSKLLSNRNDLLETAVYHESYNDAFGYLNTTIRPFGFDAERYILSAYIENMQYANAQSFLNSMSATTEHEQDYKYVQNINLQRLTTLDYEVSELVLQSLRDIAYKQNPLGGKASAVYLALTGDRILFEETEIDIDKEDLVLREASNEKNITVMPNPMINSITIDGNSAISRISLFNMNGQLVLDKSDNTMRTLDVSSLKSGIYLIMLYNDADNLLHSERIIKID